MTEKRINHPVVVSLQDVVAEMDLPNEEWTAYLNRHTGELVTITDEDQRLAEAGGDSEDLPEWQRNNLPKVREVLESDEFLSLPEKFDIHEYVIMERFCLGIENAGLRAQMLGAIGGRGAFRQFKNLVHECGIAKAWYEYRQHALEDIAADWLDANGIGYSREKTDQSHDGA